MVCYEKQMIPVMLKEIFYDSLKISSVTGWQNVFFPYESFLFPADVAIASFEICG